jgi:hypothetical protein
MHEDETRHAQADRVRAARIHDLCERLVPAVSPSSSGEALPRALIALADLVVDFLEADRLYQQPLCLHRYRGIVREQETERRRKRRQRARAELAHAVRRSSETVL